MKAAAVLLVLATSSTGVSAAVDLTHIPDTCKTTVEMLKADKAKFSELGGVMGKALKAKDNAGFCTVAKQTLAIVLGENGQLDQCLGDLTVDKTVPQATVGQFIALKSNFRKALDAAKVPGNDRMHCGLTIE